MFDTWKGLSRKIIFINLIQCEIYAALKTWGIDLAICCVILFIKKKEKKIFFFFLALIHNFYNDAGGQFPKDNDINEGHMNVAPFTMMKHTW